MTAPAPLDLPDLLDGLERAHAAATPGPWIVWHAPDVLAIGAGHRMFRGVPSNPTTWVASDVPPTDAAATVALHNAFPTLIAELRKRDAALRAVRAVLAAYDTGIPAPIPPAELRAALSPESVQS